MSHAICFQKRARFHDLAITIATRKNLTSLRRSPVAKLLRSAVLLASLPIALLAQGGSPQIEGKEVFKNNDVVFHEIDGHTWVGSGHVMSNESVYLVEGNDKAVLIDAGTRIPDLDKVVASITKKPVMLVLTHGHGDHAGSAINNFPELFINPGDADASSLANYKGAIRNLKDGEVIDLGGRTLEVVFTPAHTLGSTTFLDRKAGYGFSGDSFGGDFLLLFGTFSQLKATCEKLSALMDKYGIKQLYPGHYYGWNAEIKQRIDNEATIARDALSGKVKGETVGRGSFAGNLFISAYGVTINYGESALK